MIALLPAVNETISGSFTGLRARGNIAVDAVFKNGRALGVAFTAQRRRSVKVNVPGAVKLTCGDKEYLPKNGVFTLQISDRRKAFACVY